MGNCMSAMRSDYWLRIGPSLDELELKTIRVQPSAVAKLESKGVKDGDEPPVSFSAYVLMKVDNCRRRCVMNNEFRAQKRFIVLRRGWLLLYLQAEHVSTLPPSNFIAQLAQDADDNKNSDCPAPLYYYLGYCRTFSNSRRRAVNVQKTNGEDAIFVTAKTSELYDQMQHAVGLHRQFGVAKLQSMQTDREEKISRKSVELLESMRDQKSDTNLISCFSEKAAVTSESRELPNVKFSDSMVSTTKPLQHEGSDHLLTPEEQYKWLEESIVDFKATEPPFDKVQTVMVNQPKMPTSNMIARYHHHQENMKTLSEQLQALILRLQTVDDNLIITPYDDHRSSSRKRKKQLEKAKTTTENTTSQELTPTTPDDHKELQHLTEQKLSPVDVTKPQQQLNSGETLTKKRTKSTPSTPHREMSTQSPSSDSNGRSYVPSANVGSLSVSPSLL